MGNIKPEVDRGQLQTLFHHAVKHMETEAEDGALPVSRAQTLRARALKDQALNGRGEPPLVQWFGWGVSAAPGGRVPDYRAMQEYVKLVDSAIPDWLDDLDDVEESDAGPGDDVIDALDALGLAPQPSRLQPAHPHPHQQHQQQKHGAASNKRCSKGVQVLKGKEENAKAALDAMSAGTRPGQSQSANEAAVTAALEAIEEDHAAVPAPLKGGVLPLESFPVGIPALYDMIFDTECQLAVHASWHARLQCSELFEEPWEEVHGSVSRKLEYLCSATNSMPEHRTTERQRILRDSEEDGFVVKVTLSSPELPYGAFYHVHEQYAIVPHVQGCTLRVSFALADLGLGSVAPVVAEQVEQRTRARHQALVCATREALDAKAIAEKEAQGRTAPSKPTSIPGASALKQESISEERPLQPHPGLQPATNTESNPDAILVAPPPLLAASEGATLLISAPLDHNPVTEAALNDEQVPPAEADSTTEAVVEDPDYSDSVPAASAVAAHLSDPHAGASTETSTPSALSHRAPTNDVATSATDVLDVAKSAADMVRGVPSRFEDFAAAQRCVGTVPDREDDATSAAAEWERPAPKSPAWHVDVRCVAEAVEEANRVMGSGQDAPVPIETPAAPAEDVEHSPRELVLDSQEAGSCTVHANTTEEADAGTEVGGGSDGAADEAVEGKTSDEQGSQERPYSCRDNSSGEIEDEEGDALSHRPGQQHKVSPPPPNQGATPSNTEDCAAGAPDEDMEDVSGSDTAGRWIGVASASPSWTRDDVERMTALEREVELLRKQVSAGKERRASTADDARARELEETSRLRAEVAELRAAIDAQRARHAAEVQELERTNQANKNSFQTQIEQTAADLEAKYALHTQQEIMGRETEMEKKFSNEVQRLQEVYADRLSELEAQKVAQHEKQRQWKLWSEQQRDTITRDQKALESSASELKAQTQRVATHKAELAEATRLVQDERRCLQEKLEQLEDQTRPCLKDQQVRDVWINVRCGGGRPLPRCSHAAATCHLPQASNGSSRSPQLFVFGGRDNAAARTLLDAQVFDADRLTWRQLDPGSSVRGELSQSPPAFQGHCAVPLCSDPNETLSSKVMVLGCPPKSSAHANQTLQVYVVDASNGKWQHMDPGGSAPCARSGHTATLVNGCVWVFGGEDYDQRPVDADLYVLDLNTVQWRRAVVRSLAAARSPPPPHLPLPRPGACAAPPAPRAHHVAAAVGDRFLVVFGGAANNDCMNDTRVFDTSTLEWLTVEPQGTPPGPRAGHAAAMLGRDWYVLGGGNNKSALYDLHVLRITTSKHASSQGSDAAMQMRWRRVDDGAASGEEGPRAGGEGLSLVALPPRQACPGCLLAFGGYDGTRSLNHLWVFTPGALMDVADALRGVLQSVKAAPNDTQQEVGAALAKCLMLTQRHPRAHDLSDAFKDNLQAKAEEIDMVAREAAEQAAVYAATLVMRTPIPGEGHEQTKLRAAKAAVSMAVQVAGSMAAAAHIRSQTDWYHIQQEQQVAQRGSRELDLLEPNVGEEATGLQRTPEKTLLVQETSSGAQHSGAKSLQTNGGLWKYFSGSSL